MSAVTTLHVPPDGWTVDDLPEELRCELVDGTLVVPPLPELRHDEAAGALMELLLRAGLPPHLRVLLARGVRFDRGNYRVPDLLVYRRAASTKGVIEPEDVALVVEVVSPSSLRTDRVDKPAQYAASGMPLYWRLELDPLVLVTYALDGDVYRETGRFADQVDVTEPVPLRFSIGDLLA